MADGKTATNLQDQPSPTSPAPAQNMPSEGLLDALKMILLGAPLNEVLTSVTRLIEAHSKWMLCSIFLLDEDGSHLRYAAAANLPEAYRAASDGVCIGPNVGSCGAALHSFHPSTDYKQCNRVPDWSSLKTGLEKEIGVTESSVNCSRLARILVLAAPAVERFCVASESSPISSRKIVPSWADSKRPVRR